MSQLEEIEFRKKGVQQLIFDHNRRLQVLKHQQAVQGLINARPEVIIEIEDIEAEVAKLQEELSRLIAEEIREKAPLVYIHNFGQRSTNVSDRALCIEWGEQFDARQTPRKIPEPAVWQSTLLPEILAIPGKLGGQGLVRLQGSAALTTGFAFGTAFQAIGRYLLEVEQFSPNGVELWYSDEQPPASQVVPELTNYSIAGNPAADEAVVVIYAAPKQSLTEVLTGVGTYWGEIEIFKNLLADQKVSQKFNGVLVLEAKAAAGGRPLQSWEAAGLAHRSVQPLKHFIGQFKPAKLHLFLATPLGLAVFLGHQWNAIGKKIQCYEWVSGDKVYAPTGELQL